MDTLKTSILTAFIFIIIIVVAWVEKSRPSKTCK